MGFGNHFDGPANFIKAKQNDNPPIEDPVEIVDTSDEEAEEEICAICMEQISAPHMKTLCGHRFHTDCIRQIVWRNPACPCCRARK